MVVRRSAPRGCAAFSGWFGVPPPPIFYYKCAYLQKSLSLLACGKYEEEARWLIFRSIFRGIKCLYVDPPLKPPSLFF